MLETGGLEAIPGEIGPYRIVGKLGRGGMGVVYRGEHRLSGDVAAVKTVPVPNAGLLQSLRREMHMLARLRHPGIAGVLDSGVHEGVPWYAMELVEGASLRELGNGGRTSQHRVLTILRRLCSALVYLHGEGLVHCDLKPDNIMISLGDLPVLVDFGLSWRFSGPLSRDVLEVDAGLGGTSAYMAPEQLRGDPVDARADLYALGCLLYGLLTGRPPFLTMQAVLDPEGRAEPPSSLANGIGPELDALVLKLLCKEPRDRPGHASVVAAKLAAMGAENGAASSGPKPRPYLYRPGLAGRGEILKIIGRSLGEHATQGTGDLMMIGGESGVGKTRLVLEIARAVQRRGLTVLLGECVETDLGSPRESPRTPLQAFTRPLQSIGDRCREGGIDAERNILGNRGAVLAQYEPSLRLLPGQKEHAAPEELPAAAARTRVFTSLADTLAALGRHGSRAGSLVVVVLDDLQWADELSLGFLRFLVKSGRLRTTPLIVIGTYRSEELADAESSGLRELLEQSECRCLELQRLGDDAIGEMIGDMLAITVPSRFVESLARHTEGNPFFVAEYLRTAVAEGLLDRDYKGRWYLAEAGALGEESVEGLPLPRSVRELVARRLVGLPGDAAALIAAGSVLGREVLPPILALMTPMSEESRLQAVTELLRRQVFEERLPRMSESRLAGYPTLRFVHDKIREIAYSRLSLPERGRLHRAAAEAIEAGAGHRSDEDLGSLGRHWEEAGEPDRAKARYLEAARTAVQRSSLEEALRLARSAKRLGERAEAGLLLAQALSDLSQHDASLVEAREVECSPTSSLEERVRAGVQIASVLNSQGCSLETLEQVDLILRSNPSVLYRRMALQARTTALKQLGRFDEALREGGEALALARELGDGLGVAAALDSMGMIHRDRGEHERAIGCFQEALTLSRASGRRRTIANHLNNLGVTYWSQGSYGAADACYQESLRLHRDIGHRAGIANNLANLGVLRFERGAYSEALELFKEALVIQREVGARHWIATCLLNLGSTRGLLGQLEEAMETLEQAQMVLREVRIPLLESATLGAIADCYASLGQFDAAEKALDEGIQIADAHGLKNYLADHLLARARLRFERRPVEGLDDAERALALALELRVGRREAGSLAALARYHAKGGRSARALEEIERARSLVTSDGDLNLYMQVCEDEAMTRLSTGDTRLAEAVAREAAAIASAHGALPQLARIERILRGIAEESSV